MPEEDTTIRRTEYEARNTLFIMNQNRLESRLDNLDTKVDNLGNKVDNLNASIWKFIAITCLNFLLGGGAVALIEFLIKR